MSDIGRPGDVSPEIRLGIWREGQQPYAIAEVGRVEFL